MLGATLLSLPYWLGGLLTLVAVIHFFVTRPDTYWIFVIIFLGPLGSLAYLVVNVILPRFSSAGPLKHRVSLSFDQRRRVKELELKVEEMGLPRDSAELGELLYRRGNPERAEKMLRHALQHDDEPETAYWLAVTLEKLGQPEEASQLLAPIVREDPRFKFGDAYLAYGRSLAAAGHREEALKAFRKVLEQSSLTETRVRYGLLLADTGQTDEARGELERAVREAKSLPGFNMKQARPYVRKAKQWLARHR
ncbi:MAG: tetratricopeptide repeat protein [Candidatus Lernaella stagnicola]|nr:tetratricopeptide repeat protein [Candidatus Lernaella stagnicola]